MKDAGPARSSPQPQPNDPLHLRKMEGGEPVFGERLLVLGSGPLPGSSTGLSGVALRENGEAVLLVSLPALSGSEATRIADQLDRLAEAGEDGLAAVGPMSGPEIRSRFEAFFGPEATETAALNSDQSALVVVRKEPTREGWRSLLAETGDRLHAVYLARGTGMERRNPPPVTASAEEKRSGLLTWLALGGLVLGMTLGLIGLVRALRTPAAVTPTPVVLGSALSNVALEVSPDATNSGLIGQQRLLRTSGGALLFLYPEDEQLKIVGDQRNQGRNWRSPATVPDINVDTLSAAIDSDDRLHVAGSGPDGVIYAVLRPTRDTWEIVASEVIYAAPTGIVDIAWDRERRRAHVVWSRRGDTAGEQPHWALLSESDGEISIDDEEALADPGDRQTVLVNIAVAQGRAIAGYRRGDSTGGWFARPGRAVNGTFTWGAEERLPNTPGTIGAASIAFDNRSTAHVLLRDDTNFDLRYFRRARRSWTSGRTIVNGQTLNSVEFPALSVDDRSGLVYAFFQTDAFLEEATEVRFSLFDPATGWEGPYAVVGDAQLGEGAFYPTVMRQNAGLPLVLWTSPSGPTVTAARVPLP